MFLRIRPSAFDVLVKRSTAGLGVFTNERIPKRRFIMEYWGDVITDDEAQYVGGRYLFEIGNGKTINGSTRKNIARYINHSCAPNCEVEVRGNHVLVFSRRVIQKGTELTYDYGKEYWNAFIAPHGCRCSACTRKQR